MMRVVMVLVVVALTVLSGICDAQGFVQASRIWTDGRLHPEAVVRSGAGFAAGICIYWVCLRHLDALGVRAPEVQTLMWFGTTLIGVALISGAFLTWRRADQLVAFAVLLGIAWLMVRTGEA